MRYLCSHLTHCLMINCLNISSRFSRNSEANASEFLENLEEKFHRYYMHSDINHTIHNTVKKKWSYNSSEHKRSQQDTQSLSFVARSRVVDRRESAPFLTDRLASLFTSYCCWSWSTWRDQYSSRHKNTPLQNMRRRTKKHIEREEWEYKFVYRTMLILGGCLLNPLDRGNCESFRIHSSATSIKETFLQDSIKRRLQNYHNILKKCFPSITCIVMYLVATNLQVH